MLLSARGRDGTVSGRGFRPRARLQIDRRAAPGTRFRDFPSPALGPFFPAQLSKEKEGSATSLPAATNSGNSRRMTFPPFVFLQTVESVLDL